MGSNDHYPEERPARWVEVPPFRMDLTPVTVSRFNAFVQETGYVTVAEQRGHSHVFVMTQGPVPLNDPSAWWRAAAGASWRCPSGQGSEALADHPVVHIALADAKAYAAWAGGSLPTEAQWEYAARGGLQGQPYAWGAEFAPDGQRMAHVWRGAFPWYVPEGHVAGTVPVGQFPANGFGLLDMIGNTWEWTLTQFIAGSSSEPVKSCCSKSADEGMAWAVKGGSHLCAAEYCLRYRPAARTAMQGNHTTSHLGFRCVYSAQP